MPYSPPDLAPPDLDRLLAATASGDAAAFRALYERTSAKLFGVVLRIVRERGAAEDVLQDAFVRIWQGAATYSPSAGRPMTWLIAIARHRAIDAVRGARPVLVTADTDGGDVLATLPDGRDRESEFADADELGRCLGRLDAVQRDCLLLAYRDGLSREELAGRFGAPVNTVKTWLHRGAQSLRRCLEAA